MDYNTSSMLLLSDLPKTRGQFHVLRSTLKTIPYHLKSFWLFTFSDLKTIVGPCTAFAILQQIGVSAFGNGSSSPPTSSLDIIQVIKVICWTWISLLPFNIDNQRQSVEEDGLNKPWRPIPAGRMTSEQATIMMLILYPVAICFGIATGAPVETILLVGLGIWYNDLKGANSSWIIRNFINACGITCFLSGALSVMLHTTYAQSNVTDWKRSIPLLSTSTMGQWLAILFGIIFTGIQTQDMYDQVGDKILNRKTMPLVFGDIPARWSIAVPVLFWSVFCPYFWSLSAAAYLLPLTLGAMIAWRTLSKRTVKDDKKTSKLWNLWLVVFFTLPAQQVWFA